MAELTTESTTPHMNDLRVLMMAQLHALRAAAPGDALEAEIKRSKGVSELAGMMVSSARVEVDYLALIEGDGDLPFLTAPKPEKKLPPQSHDVLSRGPGDDHPWKSGRTVHKMEG
jgi:hypothetical protein